MPGIQQAHPPVISPLDGVDDADHVGHQFDLAEELAQQKQSNPLRAGLQLERVPAPCVMVIFGVTGDLTSRFNAVDLVRKGSEALGGKGGGGRPDMAQAGGPDGSKADAALEAIAAAMGA